MKNASTSGLVRYLFGADLSGSLKKEDFVKLQADLISDVLEMEFTRYAEDTNHNISETDFCRHLLYSSSISQKKKEKMIKMVADRFNGKSEGISFFELQDLLQRPLRWGRSREGHVLPG